MQIQVNNDFTTDGPFTQAQINSFLQDEQTAINILDSTFTNNITVTFDVGFGSYRGQVLNNQTRSTADVNSNAVFTLSYSQLRNDLLTFGQPGFFNAANLPAGTSINGVSNFYVSSSVGEGHRSPRSGRAAQHQRWGRGPERRRPIFCCF